MKKTILLSVLIIISINLYSDSDLELARLYMDEAFYNYNQGNLKFAEKNLNTAMGFSDSLSEIWYLLGLLSDEQGNRIKAINLYKKSIELGNYYSNYFYDLYFRYINLLNITGKHKAVLDFFLENKDIFMNSHEILLLVSDSSYKYGNLDLSIKLAYDVYKSDPDNLKSLLYLLLYTKDESYYHYIEKNRHNLEIEKLDEIFFQNIILSDYDYINSDMVELYFSLFGETPFYFSLLNIKSESIDKSRNLLIRSSGNEILEDGVYFGDYNFDGISDEIISVSADELTYLKDQNQDNITDLSINFLGNIPTNIFVNKGNITYEFKYAEYPYLEEIQYSKNSIKRIYKVFPGTEFTPLGDLNNFYWKYNTNRISVIEEFNLEPVDLLKMSYLFTEYRIDSDTPFREYQVLNGEIIQIKEDSQQNGNYDHFMEISAWKLIAGRRDLNNDGLIDIFESYENGKITGIAVDWNNNGKPEYIEDWSVLNIKTWDFNEDSYIDAELIGSMNNINYNQIPIENDLVNQYDIFSWDFSYRNFWFNNY